MEEKKPTSEFENLIKEATGEIPVVNAETQPSEQKSDVVSMPEEVAKTSANKTNETINAENIQVVDDNSKVELPQTKDGKESSVAVNIDSAASVSQTIGTIKPDKQKSPIAMLVLFGALILFILFMPTAISLVNKYFGTNFNVDSLNNVQNDDSNDNKNNNNNNKQNDKQEIKMYDLKEDTVIQIGKIDLSGFKKDNTDCLSLLFYIKNNGTVLYKFDKKLYLEYYDNNNTFVGRSYLENVKEITGGITNNYNIDISNDIFSKATKVELVQRTEDDYPSVNLENNRLTCSNDDNDIVYTFNNTSKLIGIKDKYTYTKNGDDLKYSDDLITYKTKVAKLDIIEGVTAVLNETDSGFITNIVIDYQSADYSKLSSNTNYYVKDTYAKVISFEMNAKGYTCR